MKNLKIWSLLMLLAATVSSCNNGTDKPAAGLEHIVNEWKLATWGGADAPFTVYIDFNEDNTYEMYQQVYGLEFVKFSGTYNVSGNIVTGTYSDGQNWKSGYKASISGDFNTLVLNSQEDASIESVYEVTLIPEDIRTEASTRSVVGVEPLL